MNKGRCVFSCFFIFSLCVFPTTGVTAEPCAHISFDTTDVNLHTSNPSLGSRYKRTLVHFNVIMDSCPDGSLGPYRLIIRAAYGHVDDIASSVEDLCNTTSDWSTPFCGCRKTRQGLSCYAGDLFLSGLPSITWKLEDTGGGGRIETKIVHFNVLYPAFLKEFYINSCQGSPVTLQNGHTAQFQCKGDWGNPARPVVLLDPRNSTLFQKIKIADAESQIALKTSKQLSCDHPNHSGQYRCHMKGTDQFKALTVLVACPFKFKGQRSKGTIKAESGQDVFRSFLASSHTRDIGCHLIHPHNVQMPCNTSKSVVTLTGSPPDVVINLKLNGVIEDDQGDWALTASTPQGSDTVLLLLMVKQGHSTTTVTNTTTLLGGNPETQDVPWTGVGLLVGAVAGGVFVAVIVTIVYVWKNKCGPLHARPARPDEHVYCDLDYISPNEQSTRNGEAGPDNRNRQEIAVRDVRRNETSPPVHAAPVEQIDEDGYQIVGNRRHADEEQLHDIEESTRNRETGLDNRNQNQENAVRDVRRNETSPPVRAAPVGQTDKDGYLVPVNRRRTDENGYEIV